MDSSAGVIPPEDLTFDDLIGESECVEGTQVPVDTNAIKEALASGLFTARGSSRLGWAHHSYAEFLAALYLRMNGLAPWRRNAVGIKPPFCPQQRPPLGAPLEQLPHHRGFFLDDDDPTIYGPVSGN